MEYREILRLDGEYQIEARQSCGINLRRRIPWRGCTTEQFKGTPRRPSSFKTFMDIVRTGWRI